MNVLSIVARRLIRERWRISTGQWTILKDCAIVAVRKSASCFNPVQRWLQIHRSLKDCSCTAVNDSGPTHEASTALLGSRSSHSLRIANMVRRLGGFLDLAQCGDCADAFGEDIDRNFGCNRSGCATERLALFVGGFV